jgi:Phage DNA packaging protein, Nu1 subunit of terminase
MDGGANSTETKIDGITPSMAKKLLEANNKVLVSRLQKGKPLSTSDRSKLEEIASIDKTAEYLRDGVSTWTELASVLGITRRTLQNWRKKKGAPVADENGKHNIGAWVEFINADKLDEHDEEFRRHKLRILKAQADERELRNGILSRKYVALSEVQEGWIGTTQKAIALMRSKFENELPPLYTLNPVQNMKLNQSAIDEICRIMSTNGEITP